MWDALSKAPQSNVRNASGYESDDTMQQLKAANDYAETDQK